MHSFLKVPPPPPHIYPYTTFLVPFFKFLNIKLNLFKTGQLATPQPRKTKEEKNNGIDGNVILLPRLDLEKFLANRDG